METNNEREQRAKLTIYDKLNDCRLAFKNANVKKSGKNAYAGYDYFELDDILNALIPILVSNRATTIVNFTPEGATLTFYDCETKESIVFTSPMSTASLKGCHEVQNLGAVESYIKRYLYQNAFEIAEPDSLDRTMGRGENQTGKKPAQNQQKKSVPAQESPEDKAKRFAAVVEKYAQKNTKVTLEILGTFNAKTPADIPAEKRNDVISALKQKITLN
jgi:hypothetical protein